MQLADSIQHRKKLRAMGRVRGSTSVRRNRLESAVAMQAEPAAAVPVDYSGVIRSTMTRIKRQYCNNKEQRPADDILLEIECPCCEDRLLFAVSATTGKTAGQCQNRKCRLEWSEEDQ